jgi:TonB family protein
VYPAAARKERAQGTTLLRVHILTDGRVGEVQVERSAGHPALDQAATDAVSQWHFEPARNATEPVAVWVVIPVEFRLTSLLREILAKHLRPAEAEHAGDRGELVRAAHLGTEPA